MKQTIILSLLSLFAATISAQEIWTLQQCIDYALDHNISIKMGQPYEQLLQSGRQNHLFAIGQSRAQRMQLYLERKRRELEPRQPDGSIRSDS